MASTTSGGKRRAVSSEAAQRRIASQNKLSSGKLHAPRMFMQSSSQTSRPLRHEFIEREERSSCESAASSTFFDHEILLFTENVSEYTGISKSGSTPHPRAATFMSVT
jgi:hypothetical protein